MNNLNLTHATETDYLHASPIEKEILERLNRIEKFAKEELDENKTK